MSGLSLKENLFLCPSLGGRRGGEGEEEGVSLHTVVGFIYQETADQHKPFPSSLATALLPLLVKVLQYTISTDHPVRILA